MSGGGVITLVVLGILSGGFIVGGILAELLGLALDWIIKKDSASRARTARPAEEKKYMVIVPQEGRKNKAC